MRRRFVPLAVCRTQANLTETARTPFGWTSSSAQWRLSPAGLLAIAIAGDAEALRTGAIGPATVFCYIGNSWSLDNRLDDITALLREVRDGDRESLDKVFKLVYPRLKQLAAVRLAGPEQTLTPTSLVNETYEKMVRGQPVSASNRAHFFACAGKAMRQIIIDHARAANADKRGGRWLQVTFSENIQATSVELLELDRALNDLAHVDQRLIDLVELKFFCGLTIEHIAEQLNVSPKTVTRDWTRARAFLNAQMSGT